MTVVEYYRPGTLDEALARLSQRDPACIPLGGGTGIDRHAKNVVGVVDLQLLGLRGVEQEGARIKVGAATSLQELLDSPLTPPALRQAIELEASYNQRQIATIAGKLVTAGGRSPLAAVLLAMDAELVWAPGEVRLGLGDWLPFRQAIAAGAHPKPGLVIQSVTWPEQVSAAFQYIARTPADLPIVCIALGGWNVGSNAARAVPRSAGAGRRRVVAGGFGPAPVLAMDGPEAAGAEAAVSDAYSQAGDEWASAEYRHEMAALLTRRGLQELEGI